MARNASGTYTLPAGNPVTGGTLIEATWANNTLSDLATAMTESLSREGEGGMNAALRLADGTVSVPGVAFVNETTSGFYRAGSGDVRLSISGADVVQYLTTGVAITGTLSASGNVTLSGGTANGVLYLDGSKVATSGSALTFDGTNVSTTGSIISSTAPAGGSLKRDVTSSYLSVTGGTAPNSNGATILLSGSTYAAANTAFIDATESVFRSLNGASEYMRLTSTGLGIGLGGASPTSKLDARLAGTSSGSVIQVGNTSSGEFGGLGISDGGAYPVQLWGSSIAFLTGSSIYGSTTERARIDASGDLGLAVTPKSTLTNTTRSLQLPYSLGLTSYTGSLDTYLHSNLYPSSLASGWANNDTGGGNLFRMNGGAFTWYSAASGSADANSSLTTAMTLDASGRLGIGETSPAQKLHISAASANAAIRLTRTGTFPGDFMIQAGGYGAPSFLIYDNTAAAERFFINSSGDVLVACTSVPGAGSTTEGVGLLSTGAFTNFRAAATPFFCGRSNDGEVMALYSGATQRGTVSISGATTTYTSVSDYRLKENVTPIAGGLGKVMALKPSSFNFIEFPDRTVNGFIAHEVAEVEPTAVFGEKDAVDAEGKPVYQGVDPAKLVPLLTAAIQEQQAIIEQLKARLDAANL